MMLRFIVPLLIGLLPVSAFAESALSPTSTPSFADIFESERQTTLRELQDLAIRDPISKSLQPFFLDFVPVENVGSVVEEFLFWNATSLEASGRDHVLIRTSADPCVPPLSYEQFGPHRSSRAIAMVHLSMFEAVNAIGKQYTPYTDVVAPDLTGLNQDLVMRAAIKQAAYATLAALYPNQNLGWLVFKRDERVLPVNDSTTAGMALGDAAAGKILAKRAADKSNEGDVEGRPRKEPVVVLDACSQPGEMPFQFKGSDSKYWHQDPVSRLNIALGANWREVDPFVMNDGDQFRLPAIDISDAAFADNVSELLQVGGSGDAGHGMKSETSRTPTETMIGIFWAYDGVPQLCAPPTLYNQIVRSMLNEDGQRKNDINFVSRLFALANTAMADAAIAAWDSKFEHQVARPVTYIRDTDGSPTDGQACTGPMCQKMCAPGTANSKWCPLGAPATNGKTPNFTPPFPAYPSGHAAFGGALFQVLRNQWNGNAELTFTSDEFNGTSYPPDGQEPRDRRPQSWGSLTDAEIENAKSRIYLGIHWQIDADAGIEQGKCVADWVLANFALPVGTQPSSPTCEYLVPSK